MTMHPGDERLNDYVDGDLPAEQAREVEDHLERCTECGAEVAALRRLLAEVARLPREIAPPSDLWVGVREETVELPVRSRRTVWEMRGGLAAAAAVLVLLSSTVTAVLMNERTPDAPAPVASGSAPQAGPVGLASFSRAEAEYVRTVSDLEEALLTRRHQLSPETLRVVEESLVTIDQAIAEARAALEADPGSTELPHLLSSVYRHKIDVLERAVRLSAET